MVSHRSLLLTCRAEPNKADPRASTICACPAQVGRIHQHAQRFACQQPEDEEHESLSTGEHQADVVAAIQADIRALLEPPSRSELPLAQRAWYELDRLKEDAGRTHQLAEVTKPQWPGPSQRHPPPNASADDDDDGELACSAFSPACSPELRPLALEFDSTDMSPQSPAQATKYSHLHLGSPACTAPAPRSSPSPQSLPGTNTSIDSTWAFSY